MRWPWRSRQQHRDRVAEAQRHLHQVQRQQPQVERLARELEARRRANQFSEAVRQAFGGQ